MNQPANRLTTQCPYVREASQEKTKRIPATPSTANCTSTNAKPFEMFCRHKLLFVVLCCSVCPSNLCLLDLLDRLECFSDRGGVDHRRWFGRFDGLPPRRGWFGGRLRVSVLPTTLPAGIHSWADDPMVTILKVLTSVDSLPSVK